MVNLDHFFVLSRDSNRVYQIMSIRVKMWWSVSAVKDGFVHWEKTVQNRAYSFKWPFQFVSRPSILKFNRSFSMNVGCWICVSIQIKADLHSQHFSLSNSFFSLSWFLSNSLNDRPLRPMIVHFCSKDRPVWPSKTFTFKPDSIFERKRLRMKICLDLWMHWLKNASLT